MDKIRIMGDGPAHRTRILDADGKEIKGLHVERLIIMQNANDEENRPRMTLTLAPGSFDFDMVGDLTGIQKDIVTEIAYKLFNIQDNLHGKSLDTVQNEIYELQRQMEILANNDNKHGIVKMRQRFDQWDNSAEPEHEVDSDDGTFIVDGHDDGCGITNIPPHCTCSAAEDNSTTYPSTTEGESVVVDRKPLNLEANKIHCDRCNQVVPFPVECKDGVLCPVMFPEVGEKEKELNIIAHNGKCKNCGVECYDHTNPTPLAGHVCSSEDIKQYKEDPSFRKIYCSGCHRQLDDCVCDEEICTDCGESHCICKPDSGVVR